MSFDNVEQTVVLSEFFCASFCSEVLPNLSFLFRRISSSHPSLGVSVIWVRKKPKFLDGGFTFAFFCPSVSPVTPAASLETWAKSRDKSLLAASDQLG